MLAEEQNKVYFYSSQRDDFYADFENAVLFFKGMLFQTTDYDKICAILAFFSEFVRPNDNSLYSNFKQNFYDKPLFDRLFDLTSCANSIVSRKALFLIGDLYIIGDFHLIDSIQGYPYLSLISQSLTDCTADLRIAAVCFFFNCLDLDFGSLTEDFVLHVFPIFDNCKLLVDMEEYTTMALKLFLNILDHSRLKSVLLSNDKLSEFVSFMGDCVTGKDSSYYYCLLTELLILPQFLNLVEV